jgi:hypothetical protein
MVADLLHLSTRTVPPTAGDRFLVSSITVAGKQGTLARQASSLVASGRLMFAADTKFKLAVAISPAVIGWFPWLECLDRGAAPCRNRLGDSLLPEGAEPIAWGRLRRLHYDGAFSARHARSE